MTAAPTRRAVIAALALAGAACRPRLARAAGAGPRLAAIDWAMLETAQALGHTPVAACELIRYREDSGHGTLPADVVDLGLRGTPNLELLQLVRPDLILSSNYYSDIEARLSDVAPVVSLPFFLPGEPPLPKAISNLHVLADAVADPAAGTRAEAGAEAAFAHARARAARYAGRPFLVIEVGDARHVRTFGTDSLFGGALDRIGLRNAWADRTQFAFSAPVPIESLAPYADAWIVMPAGVPVEARPGLRRSVLWNRLGPVAEGRVLTLPDVYGFGGVPSALRFASLLADALAERAP